MDRNVSILFSARILRLFCYGFLSVILALYFARLGLPEGQIGLLFSLTLVGDAGISLWLTTSADRFGRKRTLIVGALLMAGAGVVFIVTHNVLLLLAAAIIGVISPSGNEIGPFLSVEQAALAQLLPNEKRTQSFAWYNLVGSFATAMGALSGGWLAHVLQFRGMSALAAYRTVLMGYALGGLILVILFLLLSRDVEATAAAQTNPTPRVLGLHRSRGVVVRLSGLFALDAFAGGLVVQAMIAYWFHVKFGIDAGVIGSIFFGANMLAGISALLAVRLANRIGLINTMVFTHIPSNLLLILVPAHADASIGDHRVAIAIQHLADGRADAPIVYDGGRIARRTFRRFGCHQYRPVPGRGDFPFADRAPFRRSGVAECALLPGRRVENRLRRPALSGFSYDEAARREVMPAIAIRSPAFQGRTGFTSTCRRWIPNSRALSTSSFRIAMSTRWANRRCMRSRTTHSPYPSMFRIVSGATKFAAQILSPCATRRQRFCPVAPMHGESLVCLLLPTL